MGMTVWSASRGTTLANELPGSDEVVWVAVEDDGGPPPTELTERIARRLGTRGPSQEEIACLTTDISKRVFGIPRGEETSETRAVHAFRAVGVDANELEPRLIRIEPVSIVASSDGTVVVTYAREPYSLSNNEYSAPDWRPLKIDEHFLERTKRRWDEDLQRAAGEDKPLQAPDLATIIFYGLIRSYTDVRRSLRRWLEDAEIQAAPLFGDETATTRHAKELIELRVLTLQFANTIRSLKAPAEHESESWFRGYRRSTQRASEADQKLNAALSDLAEIAESIRTSHDVVTMSFAQAQHQRAVRFEQALGLIAVVLLVPGLIASIYGANTWLPGQHRWTGLTIMLTTIGLCTVLGLFLVRRLGQPLRGITRATNSDEDDW